MIREECAYNIMVKGKRIASLDGLKGIACIIIACIYHPTTIGFCHTGGAAPVNNILFDWLYGHGWVFVELFLVISGYVTFYIYNSLIDNGIAFASIVYQLFEKRIPKWLKQKRFLNS